MRIFLITIQAAILTLFAVIGAQGESDTPHACPQPNAAAEQSCQEHTPHDV